MSHRASGAVVLWMFNQDPGAGAASGLEKRKAFLAYLFGCLLWTKACFMAAQGTANLWNTWSAALLWPSPFHLGCLVCGVLTGVGSPSLVLASLSRLCLSLSLALSKRHQLSGRRIASSSPCGDPELWILCNCLCPPHSLHPRRRVTDCCLWSVTVAAG